MEAIEDIEEEITHALLMLTGDNSLVMAFISEIDKNCYTWYTKTRSMWPRDVRIRTLNPDLKAQQKFILKDAQVLLIGSE